MPSLSLYRGVRPITKLLPIRYYAVLHHQVMFKSTRLENKLLVFKSVSRQPGPIQLCTQYVCLEMHKSHPLNAVDLKYGL